MSSFVWLVAYFEDLTERLKPVEAVVVVVADSYYLIAENETILIEKRFLIKCQNFLTSFLRLLSQRIIQSSYPEKK